MRGGRAKRDDLATVIEEAVSLRATPLIPRRMRSIRPRPDFVGPPSPASREKGGRFPSLAKRGRTNATHSPWDEGRRERVGLVNNASCVEIPKHPRISP